MMSDRGTRPSKVIVVLVAVTVLLGAVGPVAADNGPPAPPSSYYGTVTDEGGATPADGTTIVAVGYDGNGGVVDRDSIDVRNGQYGGSGGFDDKLRIASDATRVVFYVGSTNGTKLTPVDKDPTSGVHEWDLTASGGAFGGEISTTQPSTTTTPTTQSPTAQPQVTETPKAANPSTETAPTTPPPETSAVTTTTESNSQTERTTTQSPTTTTASGKITPIPPSEITTAESDDEGGLPLSLRTLSAVLLLLGAVVYGRSTISSLVARASTLPAMVGLTSSEPSEEGQVRVTNGTDDETACKVRCRTPSETIFTERCTLEAGESETIGTVPEEKFQLAVARQRGGTTTKVLQPQKGDVEIQVATDGVRFE